MSTERPLGDTEKTVTRHVAVESPSLRNIVPTKAVVYRTTRSAAEIMAEVSPFSPRNRKVSLFKPSRKEVIKKEARRSSGNKEAKKSNTPIRDKEAQQRNAASLREIMKERGLSVGEVVRLLGISRTTVRRRISGVSSVSEGFLEEVSSLPKVTPPSRKLSPEIRSQRKEEGTRLSAFIKGNNWSNEGVGEFLGCNVAAIVRMQAGKVPIPSDIWTKLKEAAISGSITTRIKPPLTDIDWEERRGVGRRLNELRKEKGLTTSELGERLCMTQGYLNNIFRGESRIPQKLIDFLDQ